MYPGGHGQPPGPPGPPGPGPVGPPGGGEGWTGVGSSSIGTQQTPLTMGSTLVPTGPLGQTMLPSGPLTTLSQGLGMNTLGSIITGPNQPQGATALMNPTGLSPSGSGSLTPPGDGSQPHFLCPRRPNLGRDGRPIQLRANHFQVGFFKLISYFIYLINHCLDIYAQRLHSPLLDQHST